MDAKTILAAAREDPFYLGHGDLATKTSWKTGAAGSGAEDVLVDSKDDTVIFSALVTIQADDFYLTPHCGFDPGRVPAWQASKGPVRALAESKATALLGAVPSLLSEFKLYEENLKALFPGVMPYEDKSGMVVKRGERTFFKINHQMFSLREGVSPDDVAMAPATGSGSDNENTEVLDMELIPAFRMANWPVPETCVRLRDAIVKTHQVNPVPAFMKGNNHPIIPANYTRLLRGAIARVHFTVSHKVLRRKIPVSFFSATLDEIIILQTHAPADLAPSKARLASRFLMHPPANDDDASNEASPSKPSKRRRA